MSTIRVTTNFNISLEFTAAPFHYRFFAWLVDLIVLLFYCLTAYKVIEMATSGRGGGSDNMGAIIMVLILPFLTYHLICELSLNGQSVGKRIMGLRVVNEEGGRPGIGQFIIRWLIRTSDYMVIVIAIYAPVGFGGDASLFWQVAAAFCLLIADVILVNTSKRGQRLGDMLAHTMLIRTREKSALEETIYLDVREDYVPSFPQVMQLSDRDINSMKSILDAAVKHADYNLANRAAEKIKQHLKIETSLSPFDFLEVLLKDYNHLSRS